MRHALVFFLLAFAFPTPALPAQPALPEVGTYDQLLHAIREARAASEKRVEQAVDREKVREAWETGKLIDEHILHHKERADYGKQVIERLSADLGMSRSELNRMVEFARAYPIRAPARKVSWSHYRELLSLNDSKERDEVTQQAEDQSWNRDQVREEVRRRQHRTEAPVKLPEITPGPLYTYQVIRLKDRLKIDLGFGIYHDLPEKDAKKFKEGDIVSVVGARLPAGEAGSPRPLNQGGETPPLQLAEDAVPADLFTYNATVTQVVDGDTFHALIDLGFETTLAQRVRLRRIDAPEIVTADGKEAKAYLEKILSRNQGRILLKSTDLDQHGRPIANVWVQNRPVDQELLDEGLAVRISE